MASVRRVYGEHSVLMLGVGIPTQYARYARGASICEPQFCPMGKTLRSGHSSAAKGKKKRPSEDGRFFFGWGRRI